MVVIAAGRNERRARAQALGDFKTQHAAIKTQRPIEIGDLEMNMPDPRSRDDGRRWFRAWSISFLTSLRLRGEVGSQRSCETGEGVQVYR